MSPDKNLIINVSIIDLLEIYHQAPKVLLRCATKVSVKKESLHKLNQEPIILVKVKNGNYWVIPTQDVNVYWLLPKNNLRVNDFEYQSLQYLFELQGYQKDTNNYFTVIEPAKVSYSGKEWTLQEKGILHFTQTNPSDDVDSEDDEQDDLKQLQLELSELASQLSQVREEHQQLQSHLTQIEQERNELRSQFQIVLDLLDLLRKDVTENQQTTQGELESIKHQIQNNQRSTDKKFEYLWKKDTEIDNQVKALENKINEINHRVDQNQQATQREISNIRTQSETPPKARATTIGSNGNDNSQNPQSQENNNHQGEEQMPATTSETSQPPIDLSKLTKDSLVDIYNHQPERLFPHAIEVVESEDTARQRRAGSNVSLVLIKSKQNKGICWIIEVKGILYLVPKAKLKFHVFILNKIQCLFDCQNYGIGNSHNFILDKPAEVVSSGESWTLKEKGILKFEKLSS